MMMSNDNDIWWSWAAAAATLVVVCFLVRISSFLKMCFPQEITDFYENCRSPSTTTKVWSSYDIIIWHHHMTSSYDVIIWHHHMTSTYDICHLLMTSSYDINHKKYINLVSKKHLGKKTDCGSLPCWAFLKLVCGPRSPSPSPLTPQILTIAPVAIYKGVFSSLLFV